MTKFSVVIVAYNMRQCVETIIENVRNQPLTDTEIICVDDGSADGTRELLQLFTAEKPQTRLLCHEEKQGVVRTLYEGAAASSGEHILFLGGDDCTPEICTTALQAVRSFGSGAVFDGTAALWNRFYCGAAVRQALACFSTAGSCVTEELLAAYLALFMGEGPVDNLLGELAYQLRSCGEEVPAQIAAALCERSLFRPNRDQIRTVGTFYYRLKLGGVEMVLSNLAHIWKDMGYEVVVFTDEEPSLEDYPLPAGVRRIVLPSVVHNTQEEYIWRVKVFREALENNRIDTMVYHGWLNPKVVTDALCIKSTGVPLIIHTHGMFAANFSVSRPNYVQKDLLLSRCFRLSECVVTLTEVDQAWWNAMGNRSYRTVNPLNRSVEETPVASADGHTVLWVGRLSAEKQPEDALRIVELVRRQVPDVRLKFLGKGEDGSGYEEALKKKAKELGLEDTVSFEGFHTDLEPYYRQAAVLLSTSCFEGFGMVFMESKAYGLPLVMYELSNLDIVRRPHGLYAVPQKDYVKAAQHLVELLTDNELRYRLGREARASAEEIYRTDAKCHWQEIFALALTPAPVGTALNVQSPLETAVTIAVDRLSEGLRLQWAEVQRLEQQIVSYDASLKEIQQSTAYRLGMAITALPRKLRDFLRR